LDAASGAGSSYSKTMKNVAREVSLPLQQDDDEGKLMTEPQHNTASLTKNESSMHEDSNEKDHSHASASSSNNVSISRNLGAELRKSVQLRPKTGLFNLVNDSQGGKSFEETYEKINTLGEGGFASVFRCQHKKNKSHYAVKEIFHEDYEFNPGANSLKEEIAAMKALRESPYIVRLFDVFEAEISFNKVTYLVMEEMEGGDLLDRITDKRTYSEIDTRAVARSLLQAVRFMHNKDYAHRDIKPENILLLSRDDDTTIKLCDFGCSQKLTGPNCMQDMAGSPQYAAPEVYNRTLDMGYGKECDLWSVGCVLYVMLGGYAPFEADSVYELAEMVCEGDWAFHDKFWSEISQPPKDLITQLLTVDAEKRFTAEQALDSEWLKRRRRGDRGGLLRDTYNRSNSLRNLTRTASSDSMDLGAMKISRMTSFESLDDMDISTANAAPIYAPRDKIKKRTSSLDGDEGAGYSSEEELLPYRPEPPQRVPMLWGAETSAASETVDADKVTPRARQQRRASMGNVGDQAQLQAAATRRQKRRGSLECGRQTFWSRDASASKKS